MASGDPSRSDLALSSKPRQRCCMHAHRVDSAHRAHRNPRQTYQPSGALPNALGLHFEKMLRMHPHLPTCSRLHKFRQSSHCLLTLCPSRQLLQQAAARPTS
eukprot:6199543-Pleurochrysis_carterae.AAC.1